VLTRTDIGVRPPVSARLVIIGDKVRERVEPRLVGGVAADVGLFAERRVVEPLSFPVVCRFGCGPVA